MDLGGNSILITGGATGIGLAFAERFLKAGSEVAICGRREEKLNEAREQFPKLRTRVCDIAVDRDRVLLAEWAASELPGLNVLVNNAGVQNRLRLDDAADWERARHEIATNLEAPLHLTSLLIPHLAKQKRPRIINVTSGLGFVPLASVPVYSATKAAMHSYTLTLRKQLEATRIEVIEVVPPAVNTDLGGPGLHTFGVDLTQFANTVMPLLEEGEKEIAYGFALQSSRASREQIDEIFARMNQAPTAAHAVGKPR